MAAAIAVTLLLPPIIGAGVAHASLRLAPAHTLAVWGSPSDLTANTGEPKIAWNPRSRRALAAWTVSGPWTASAPVATPGVQVRPVTRAGAPRGPAVTLVAPGDAPSDAYDASGAGVGLIADPRGPGFVLAQDRVDPDGSHAVEAIRLSASGQAIGPAQLMSPVRLDLREDIGDVFIAALPGGDLVVMWTVSHYGDVPTRNTGSVLVQRLGPAGPVWPQPVALVASTDGSTYGGGSLVPAAGGGGLVATWHQWAGSEESSRLQRLDAQGRPVGPSIPAWSTTIATNPTRARYLAVADGPQAFATTASGRALSSAHALVVSADGGTNVPSAPVFTPDAVAAFVPWTDAAVDVFSDDSAYLTMTDAAGCPLQGETVALATDLPVSSPAVVLLDRTHGLVVWNGHGVRQRKADESGKGNGFYEAANRDVRVRAFSFDPRRAQPAGRWPTGLFPPLLHPGCPR